MPKKVVTIKWISTIGRITKTCSSTWIDGTPHPKNAPCHYEKKISDSAVGGSAEKAYRHWVCHCETELCQFVDYHEVRPIKMTEYT